MPSNPKLVEGCKKWDKLTELFNTLDLYTASDYEPLFCTIRGNKAEVTVGSSPGHKTHIDLDKGELEYYDTDKRVNIAMKQHLEDVGLKCELKTMDTEFMLGVRCTGVNENNVVETFKTLTAATTMDIRTEDPERFEGRWGFASRRLWRMPYEEALDKLCGDLKDNMEKVRTSCILWTVGKQEKECNYAAQDYCLIKKAKEKYEKEGEI
jgi:hypothetical protein